jgi:hypothetical protein
MKATCSAVVIGIVVVSSVTRADELYRQDPVNSFGGYSSQDARNPGGLGWFSEVLDNFPGQAAWNINRVEFWGGYAGCVVGDTHGFAVRFYADNNGAPGQLLSTNDNLSFSEDPYYTVGCASGYHYAVTLTTPFQPPADGQYWISVVAILDRGGSANEPQWSWVQAVAINPPPSVQRWFGGTLAPGVDMSFVIDGVVGSGSHCGSADFNCDGAVGTDADIESFFACLSGSCPPPPCTSSADFNGDGATGTDQDIEAFFRVLSGGNC